MGGAQSTMLETDVHAPARPLSRGDRAPEARTLVDILTATALAHPDAPAIDDGQVTLSYLELVVEIEKTMARLATAGVRPGDRVGVRVASGPPRREVYQHGGRV